jgi:hypothetical protein
MRPSLHDNAAWHVNSTLNDDEMHGENIITSTHLHGDAGFVTFGNGITDTLTKQVFDTHNTYQSYIPSEIIVVNIEKNSKKSIV